MRTPRSLFLCGFVALLAQPVFAQELSAPLFPAQGNPLMESVPSGPVWPAKISLGLRDTVDLAVKNNLAAVYATEAERMAAAQRLSDLAELFPKVEARLASQQQQVNLAAFGFSGFPGMSQVIGPFALVDARAAFSLPILDLEHRHNLKESTAVQRAAASANLNTRELVVLTALNLYFQVVSAQSRVLAAEAQLARAKALHDRATDLKGAGVVPGIDVLRAEVEERAVEQRLIQASNAVRKQQLALARAIGLPPAQEFVLSDPLPAEGPSLPAMSDLLERAHADRPDIKALEARIHAAEEAVKAVKARKLPTLSAQGDYGAIGRGPGSSHGTYSLSLGVRVPLFDRSIESEALEKESDLRLRTAERNNLDGRIEFEVRSALLDLQSTSEQLQVARRSLVLAQQQLDQAQDRFSAGVANNLEVVQAQESLALADEGVIQGLYGFNIARALLARATGSAERSVQEYFPGSSVK